MDKLERERVSSVIAATIRAERAAHGLTQNELADEAGIPLQTYFRYEKGTREVPAVLLVAIADALGVPFSHVARMVDLRLAKPKPGEHLKTDVRYLDEACDATASTSADMLTLAADHPDRDETEGGL